MPLQDGKSYVESLRDGREVWLGGERVSDVTRHPWLRETIASLAELYDLQHDPAAAERLTFRVGPDGARAPLAFLMPHSREDLRRRRDAYAVWAEASYGMLARSPDYVNGNIMALAEAQALFGRSDPAFARNVARFYEYARNADIFSTHALNNPSMDRSRRVSAQDDPGAALHLDRQTDAGIVVNGAKLLATQAPMAQELLVFNSRPLQPGEEVYALAFAIPIATPGLRLICRESLNAHRSAFDHPLAARYDEMDALVVFDRVLVPWERVFICGDPATSNAVRRETTYRHHAAHQALTRGLVRARFALGVAIQAVRAVGSGETLHVRERLGTLISQVELVAAALVAGDEQCEATPWGTVRPNLRVLQAARNLFPRFHAEILDFIKTVGASSLIALPAEQDFSGPIAGAVETYYRGALLDARRKTQLFKLAWDLAGDGFGQRADLYERFYAGDPFQNRANYFTDYPVDELASLAEAFLHGSNRPDIQPDVRP